MMSKERKAEVKRSTGKRDLLYLFNPSMLAILSRFRHPQSWTGVAPKDDEVTS